MAIRIEIGIMYNGGLELRDGDVDGSTNMSNFSKEEVLSHISDEIDELLDKFQKENKRVCINFIHDDEGSFKCGVEHNGEVKLCNECQKENESETGGKDGKK